jgi:Ca-activated chloride channel homolog
MSLLNPWALLALFSLPLLVMLYFLKLKRPRQAVASTLLWQKVIEDMRVNSPFQRLRRSLLLLLQFLLLLALIIALARPLGKGHNGVGSLIVLLDTSASMLAVEPEGKTRFELAKARLLALVEGLAEEEELMVITFGTQAKLAIPFDRHPGRLRAAINALQATEGSGDLRPALALCQSVAAARAQCRLILLSDGGFPDPGQLQMPAPLEYEMIGTPQSNLAVMGLDVRRALKDRSRVELFVSLRQWGEQPATGNLNIYLNDKLLDSKFISLKGNEQTVRVEMDTKDALACDNRAWRILPPPLSRRVLVVGQRNFFIERALKAAPDLEVVSVSPTNYAGEAANPWFAVLWNAVPEAGIAPAHNLYLGCLPSLPGVAAAGEPRERTAVMDWDGAHPVCRFLDFSDLIVGPSVPLTLPETAQVILRGEAGALVAFVPNDDRWLGIVAFNPMQSNWPLLVSFPLFLHHTLNWFEEKQAGLQRRNLRVGENLSLPPGQGPPRIRLPNGKEQELTRVASGDYHFADLLWRGIYHIQPLGLAAYDLAVNEFSEREANLTPVAQPLPERQGMEVKALAQDEPREYSKPLLLAVLVILLLEWLVYHRRLWS